MLFSPGADPLLYIFEVISVVTALDSEWPFDHSNFACLGFS